MDKIKSREGATSVLIIMLLVVLMVFGLTILTTTLSNEKLSVKKQEWLSDYFDLESEVAIELASIDSKLQVIKEQAVAENTDIKNLKEDFIKLLKAEFESIKQVDEAVRLLFSVSDDKGDYKKYISVELNIPLPRNDLLSERYLKNVNYQIISYVESQDLFDYKDTEYGIPFNPKKKD